MNDNLDQILPLVELAENLGININFSSYSNLKNNRTDLLVEQDKINWLKAIDRCADRTQKIVKP